MLRSVYTEYERGLATLV